MQIMRNLRSLRKESKGVRVAVVQAALIFGFGESNFRALFSF